MTGDIEQTAGPANARSGARTALGVVLLVLGIALIVVGAIYFMVPANKLPSILGKLPRATYHRDKRAIIAAGVGAVLSIGAIFAFTRRPGARRA